MAWESICLIKGTIFEKKKTLPLHFPSQARRGRSTPLYGLYKYVRFDHKWVGNKRFAHELRVWFLHSSLELY